MYLDLGLMWRALRVCVFTGRPRLRYCAFVLFFMGLFWMMFLIVALGRFLDHIFFPGFKKQAVVKPVFIVAPPRSGTTLLQMTMSLDEERFVFNRLYQTILPSATWQWLLKALLRFDTRIGRPIARLAGWVERKWFGGWDEMHKMRFNRPEEDDGFFVYTFVTEAIFLLFPKVEDLWEAGFIDALPPKKRRRIMRYYRSCLQRRLYLDGPHKTILSKATQSSGAVEALLEEFPDAQFITIFRNPAESVASHVSVFYPVWKAHSPALPKNSPVSRSYALLAVRWYQHLFEFGHNVDRRQYLCVNYRNLKEDLMREIEHIYSHFDWTMSPAYKALLSERIGTQRRFKSNHNYTLEEFGLSKAWIQQELGMLLEEFEIMETAAR